MISYRHLRLTEQDVYPKTLPITINNFSTTSLKKIAMSDEVTLNIGYTITTLKSRSGVIWRGLNFL